MKSFKLLSLSMIGSVGFVMMFYLFSREDGSLKNGFIRTISMSSIRLDRFLELGTNNYSVVGIIGSKVYVHDVDIPYQLIEINGNVTDTITIVHSGPLKIHHSQILFDSVSFYIADLDRYAVYRGSRDDWSIQTKMVGPNFFSEFLPLNNSSIVYRSFTMDRSEYQLVLQSGNELVEGKGIIQKQIDGLFCTDGMLRLDESGRSVIYIYFYRNQFMRAGYDLQLLNRFKTIDTTSVAKIAVVRNEKYNFSSLSVPPKLVNLASECRNGFLFIHSNLRGDNEETEEFRNNDVIDIYRVANGEYLYSIYLPRNDGMKISHFKIGHGVIYVVRGNRFEIYHIDDSLILANRE